MLDEYYMRECEFGKRSFGGEAVKRIIMSVLGIRNNNNNNYKRRGMDLGELDKLQKKVKDDQ